MDDWRAAAQPAISGAFELIGMRLHPPLAKLALLRPSHRSAHLLGQGHNQDLDAEVGECDAGSGCAPRPEAGSGVFVREEQYLARAREESSLGPNQFQSVRQDLGLLCRLRRTLGGPKPPPGLAGARSNRPPQPTLPHR